MRGRPVENVVKKMKYVLEFKDTKYILYSFINYYIKFIYLSLYISIICQYKLQYVILVKKLSRLN